MVYAYLCNRTVFYESFHTCRDGILSLAQREFNPPFFVIKSEGAGENLSVKYVRTYIHMHCIVLYRVDR